MKHLMILALLLGGLFFTAATFNPVLAQKIAIDAGHSANTPGKRSAPFTKAVRYSNRDISVRVAKEEQYREHYADAGVAYYLHKNLTRNGFECVKVAWDDINGKNDNLDVSLSGRHEVIRNGNADISISCHFNAYGDGNSFNSGQGIEVFYWNADEPDKSRDSAKLARMVQKNLVGVKNQVDRGVKESRFALVDCSRTQCKASILIEFAFMTNEKEATELFCNPNVWKEYAAAVAKAVCEYVGKPYK